MLVSAHNPPSAFSVSGFCVGQFAPCHQPAVCHRTPPVIIVVDDGKRLVIRRLRVSSYVHGPLGGIIAVNALRSQLGMLDRRMVKLLIVVHPAVKVPLRPRLTGSIAAPVVIPMAVFPSVNCQVTKGLGAPGLCPSAKPCSVSKVAAFKITYPCTVSKRFLLSVPRANMTRSAGCYEIRGQTGEKCNKIFPPRKHPQKSPECQAFGGGKS